MHGKWLHDFSVTVRDGGRGEAGGARAPPTTAPVHMELH
jgi:hypothetical protein